MLAIIIIVAVVLLVLALIYWLPSVPMGGKRQTLEEAMEWQSDHYDTSFYDRLEKTPYTVKSYDDYVLHAEFLRNPEPTNDFVILSHGYSDNRLGSLKYVPTYMKLGFNCIIYDLRGHGENEPTFATYGIRGAKDLMCMINDTRKRYPDISKLVIHGESMGAATTVTTLKYEPDVDYAVADCGFSDIENVLRGIIKGMHAPSVTVDLADLGSRIRYNYALKEMRPIESLKGNKIPVCFIHGTEDDFVVPKNSEDMYKKAKEEGCKAELHKIPDATHAASVLTAPEEYRKIVGSFLEK